MRNSCNDEAAIVAALAQSAKLRHESAVDGIEPAQDDFRHRDFEHCNRQPRPRILDGDPALRSLVMRSLQHVLWRGAIALGLFLGSGAGLLALPHPAVSACASMAATPVIAAATQPRALRHRC
jgi:hypothetical protein